MRTTCGLMGVSRSGYYKWKKREPAERDVARGEKIVLVSKVHQAHKTHGYRWVAAFICMHMNIMISNCYAYKCFKYLGIRAETQHVRKYRPRRERTGYQNLLFWTWDMVDRPRQVIVSDMTVLKLRHNYYEVTFYFDVFTKEILTWRLADRRGAREQYVDALNDVVGLLSGCPETTILHTDHGSVYASRAYNEILMGTNIVRSMSRPGKPTDNPVNESLNGWIKEEIISDFNLNGRKYVLPGEMSDIIERYVNFYNEMRPSYALNYDTPTNYRRRYENGELERKDTFSKRKPTPEPKFIKLKRERSARQKCASV